jgi:16S rRNA (cytidine1402-2'-O)-methyltransferase
MVVVVSGAEEVEPEEVDVKRELRKLLDGGMSKKEAVKEVVRVHGVPRNQVYQDSLDLD